MQRYAILISCEEYKNYNNIRFCHSDAILMEQTLVNYCDYEEKNLINIMLYPDSDEDSPKKILENIQQVIDKSNEGDTILFYFAGHGLLDGDDAYLVLSNSCSSNIKDTALSIKELNQVLSKNNRANFRIFDACHSGIDTRGVVTNSFNDLVSGEGWITLASCSEKEESYPDPKLEQGIFTYCLTESIKEFKKGDFVFAEDLKVKICDKMFEWCMENYKTQTPTMNASVSGNMSIAQITKDYREDIEENIKIKEIDLGKGGEAVENKEVVNVNETQVVEVTSNCLWESPEGIKLPKRADVNTLLSYNVQLKSNELKQINMAYNSEAYEMLTSYIWDVSMKLLQSKILGLGVDFVADMVGIDSHDYINNLPPFETINLAFELGFINKLGKVRLKNNNELINEYSLRETEEEMTEDQAKEIIRVCIQYVLGQDNSNIKLEYNNFRDNLKLELIEKNPQQLDMILNSPYFYKKTTIRTLINLLKETEGAENSNVAANMITIIPYIWDTILSDERYFMGVNYAKYCNDNNEKCKSVLRNVLMKVQGFDYVPENLKSLTFIESAKRLINVHFGINNFYNEPKAVKDLSSLGTIIPKPALEIVVNAVLLVKLGNAYGVSWDAQDYADNILDSIHSEQWKGYFTLQFKSAEDVLWSIKCKDRRMERWFDIVETYNLDNLEIADPQINKLLQKSRERDRDAVSSIAYKLYMEIN